MANRFSTLSLLAANVLVPVAILIFASGFFPYKPFLSGLAQYEALEEYGAPPEAPFDKVIFMVVDALRSDFVYGDLSGFSFTQSLISGGAALPFTAHATSPTITMPRIKAITTGSIPSFLDVILNFAESDTSSTLATQDTWLAQMKTKGTGKLVMYGDDTWLKLFPETFGRADGTSSFFVTQHEMDGIVRQIYEAMTTKDHLQSTLLVLLGDHGMNDAGNHGGSAPGETSPALVFISPKLKAVGKGVESPAPYREDFQYYYTVEQSDIAPTLGALLGFPIPRNNLGAFIPHFLPFWSSKSDKVQILLRNAKQILSVVTTTFSSFELAGPSSGCESSSDDVEELACRWRGIMQSLPGPENDYENTEAWLYSVAKWLKQAQELMSSTASNYDMPKLITGQSVATASLSLAAIAISPTVARAMMETSPIVGISLLYGIMMFATSYVEEEQHFWYWTTTAWLMLLWLKCNRKGIINARFLAVMSIVILIATRVARRWNQTGQKFAGEPDIARTFFTEHRLFLWSLVGLTYLWNLQCLAARAFSRFPQIAAGAIATTIVTAALTFKLAFTNEDSPELMAGIPKSMADSEVGVSLVARARIAFIAIGLASIYTLISGFGPSKKPNTTMRTIHDLLILFLITQSRATNIPLLLIFEIQFYLLNSMELNLIDITTTSLLLQYMSFFAFGGSNAISSIDLSSAYNGVSGYNVLAVGILTFVSNWAGPIFWTSATNLMLLRLSITGQKDILRQHLSLLTVFVTSSLVFVMAACTLLRTHLFIWTVFSPKYLYSMAWSLGQHLVINMGFGSLLYWLGKQYA
ncbi:hypothetical protein EG329_006899 [Mollisiaceae sp. DMI_Dod_QoI]|nr:hypothetical protein EG329_006899 [Helotiales sp. DMI_Dod_QoI]